MLLPLSTGQLLHAFVFDRDCFPTAYGSFILNHSPHYIQTRPEDYPANLPWPGTFDIVDGLAKIADLSYPPFVSPILFPAKKTLPAALSFLSPIVSPANPTHSHLTCAVLHPTDPSCLRTYILYWAQAFPGVLKFFTLVYGALALTKFRQMRANPGEGLASLASNILRTTTFITGAIGTSWASICLFQSYFPNRLMPRGRFFLGGFLGGLWAFVNRRGQRGNFLYSSRMSIDSAWKVATKRGYVRGVRNGDVWLLVASLALVNAVYEVDPKAVSSGVLRKGLGTLRGEGWVDRAPKEEKDVKGE
jgi:hypothetical protein